MLRIGLGHVDTLSRGPTYTTIVELSSQNHNRDGLWGPNSTMVVQKDLGDILHIYIYI